MPKVLLTSEEERAEKIEKIIKKYMGSKLLTVSKLSKRIDMPKSTIYMRFKNPKKWTLEELERLIPFLEIPEEEATVFIDFYKKK
ncbi:putative transcriptional regulator [Lachnospiraceae bacterium PF1-21]